MQGFAMTVAMKRFFLVVALLLPGVAAQAQPAASFPEPIARANTGAIQCYMPDERRKTCNMTSRYRRVDGGAIEMVTLMAIARTVTMEVTEPVEIKGDKVCSVMLQSQLDAAKFVTTDGNPVDDVLVQKLREHVRNDVGKYFGHLMCTAYQDLGLNFVATQTLDGERFDREVIPMIWVRADEGYQVRR